MSLREKSHLDLVSYQIRTISRNPRDFKDAEINLGFFREKIGQIDIFRKTSPTLHEALFL